jgi:signal transduction histidine kinase
MKTFEGLEQDLIKSINEQQRVDNALQDSVNRGPKQEGGMLLRYMPVYVLLAEEGAVYWGVAKIGIDTSRMRHLLALQSEEQERIRNAIWIEIILSLLISGLLAMSLIYVWVRYITEPLRNLSAVAADFQNAGPEEFDLWLENLKRLDPQGQAEVVAIQQVLARLGAAVPRLGQRLIDGETQACLGRVLARGLSALKTRQAAAARPEPDSTGRTSPPEAPAAVRAGIGPVLDDVAHFWSDPTGEWAAADITPGLQRAWRLVSLGLPAGVTPHLNLAPLPPVWGSAAALSLAALYLLDFAVDLLPPAGDLGLAAEPTPAGGVRLTVWMSGDRRSPAACAAWLQPFADPDGIKGGLGPALAAAIAAQHGGSLAVAPRETGGAAFTLEIPPLAAVREFHEPII